MNEVPADVLEDAGRLAPWMNKAIDVAAKAKRGKKKSKQAGWVSVPGEELGRARGGGLSSRTTSKVLRVKASPASSSA